MAAGPAALLIHVEPTPYVLGFIRTIRGVHSGPVESLFIAANVTQPWNLSLQSGESILPRGTVNAAAEIRRRLASGRYALLHLAGWGHPLFVWAALVGHYYRIPMYMESDTQLSPDVAGWKRAIKRICYPPFFRLIRTLLPAGTRQAEYFRHYGVTKNRIVLAQMTVDVAGISRRRDAVDRDGQRAALRALLGLGRDDIVFVFVGRLEPRKGVAHLLEAFGALSAARPDVALLVVGDGGERQRVAAAAAGNAQLRYAGRLDTEKVIAAFCCADVALVPSLIEPFGLVVNEAMAAGLPVIASDRVGCVDDLVKHGETGLVVPAGSAGALREAMAQLADSRQLRTSMSAAARVLISGWTLEQQARIIARVWHAPDAA
jgi:glycosyltransferase involved in cell wall biosynthesis